MTLEEAEKIDGGALAQAIIEQTLAFRLERIEESKFGEKEMEYSCQYLERNESGEYIVCSNTPDRVPCIYGQFDFCPPIAPKSKENDMAFDKNWRPENWEQIKINLMNEIPITFSPAIGYSREDKNLFIERSASAVLGALASVIVTEPPIVP